LPARRGGGGAGSGQRGGGGGGAGPRWGGGGGPAGRGRFLVEPESAPLRGGEGWQLSTPPILSLAPLAASLGLFAEAGFAHLRRKSTALTGYLLELLERELGGRVRILTPSSPERRGCQVALQLDPAPRDPSRVAARLRAAAV